MGLHLIFRPIPVLGSYLHHETVILGDRHLAHIAQVLDLDVFQRVQVCLVTKHL